MGVVPPEISSEIQQSFKESTSAKDDVAIARAGRVARAPSQRLSMAPVRPPVRPAPTCNLVASSMEPAAQAKAEAESVAEASNKEAFSPTSNRQSLEQVMTREGMRSAPLVAVFAKRLQASALVNPVRTAPVLPQSSAAHDNSQHVTPLADLHNGSSQECAERLSVQDRQSETLCRTPMADAPTTGTPARHSAVGTPAEQRPQLLVSQQRPSRLTAEPTSGKACGLTVGRVIKQSSYRLGTSTARPRSACGGLESGVGSREEQLDLRSRRAFGESATDFQAQGFTAGQAKAAGFTPAEMLDGGYTAADLKNAGWSVMRCRHAGLSASAAVEGGWRGFELKQAGYELEELRAAGLSALEAKHGGWDLSHAMEAGFGVSELRSAGYSATAFQAAEASATDFKEAGFDTLEMKMAGLKAHEMRAAGYDRESLLAVGYSESELELARKKSIMLGGRGRCLERAPTCPLAAGRTNAVSSEASQSSPTAIERERFGSIAMAVTFAARLKGRTLPAPNRVAPVLRR